MDGGNESDGVTRGYFEANAAFFVTAGVAILFLHSWFALLANGSDYLDGNHQAWVIWAVVDTMLPIILGVTGMPYVEEFGRDSGSKHATFGATNRVSWLEGTLGSERGQVSNLPPYIVLFGEAIHPQSMGDFCR